MAVFDESKVISSLHKDKAEIGKQYYCSPCHIDYSYSVEKDNVAVDENIHIRPWGSD